MHAAQGFGYPFPDLESPLFLSKLVLEDDGEEHVANASREARDEEIRGREVRDDNSLPKLSSRITMAILQRLTAETYLLHDPGAGTPRQRWRNYLALHDAAVRDDDSCLPAFLERIEVQFQTNQEHVDDDAELSDYVQEGSDR